MPTLSISTTYSDGNTLTKAQLDEIKNGIETFLNSTKIDGDNIQTGGVGSSSLASSSVTDAKISSGAVSTAKIADLAVTTAKLNNDAVTEAKLADDAVSTDKIVDSAVTKAKLAALGQQISTSVSGASTTNSTFTDIGISVDITTTGRPVFVGCQPADGTNPSYIRLTTSTSDTTTGRYRLMRDSTAIAVFDLSIEASPTGSVSINIPVSSLWFIDTPSAGTYTYKWQQMNTAGSASHQTSSVYITTVAYEF